MATDAGNGLAQTDAHLYWWRSYEESGPKSDIQRIAKAGGDVETVVSSAFSPAPRGGLVTDATHVYWVSGSSRQIPKP